MRPEALIQTIYRGATDAAAWPAIVERLASATGSVSGTLLFHDDAGAGRIAASHNVDPHFSEIFFSRFAKHSPAFRQAATFSLGEIRSAAAVTSDATYKASAEYNEWAKPQGWANAVGLGLGRALGSVGVLTLMRSQTASELTPCRPSSNSPPFATYPPGS